MQNMSNKLVKPNDKISYKHLPNFHTQRHNFVYKFYQSFLFKSHFIIQKYYKAVYFPKFRSRMALNYFVLMISCICFHTFKCQFVLSTMVITSPSQTFAVPYNKTLSMSFLNFAYFIESGTINYPRFRLTHEPEHTSFGNTKCTIKFALQGIVTLTVLQSLTVKLLISTYKRQIFTLEMVSTIANTETVISLPVSYDAASSVKDLQVKVFALNIPMTFTQSLNSSHLKIMPLVTPLGITQISFSLIIITHQFQSYNVGMFIDKIKVNNLGWIILFNNDSFFDPSSTTMLVGMNSYMGTAANVLNNQNFVYYNFSFPLTTPDQRAIYIFYDIDTGAPTVMDVTLFIFSQMFAGCPNGGFLTYTQLYYDPPLSCQACHITCKTCTSVNYSLTLTDEYSCISCSSLKYLQKALSTDNSGQCKCYPGLDINPLTQQCLPCVYNCLGFDVNFMRSSTDSQFMLMFSSKVDLLMPLQENLQIFINEDEISVNFTTENMKAGIYSLQIDLKALQVCDEKCQVRFHFSHPQKVLKQGKNEALSQQQKILQVQGYYNVGDKIPDELNQAFTISSMLVGASAGGGLSSLLKMLFELQQMIEFHKYLNLQLPLVFKQFIESLSIFRFLDVTTVLPYDVDTEVQNFVSDQFDSKGPTKAIYYNYGSSFYKNIIPIVISFGAVILINFLLFIILRFIPCQIFWKFSEKLRVRALITISDMIETMILPIVVFAQFQTFTIYYQLQYLWIYGVMGFLMFTILLIPFFITTHVYMNRRQLKMKQVYQDLMQDCLTTNTATYVFFLATYYRKILFAFSLTYFIPGQIQGICILTINFLYLIIIIYIISQRVFNSKIKMLTKIINTLSMIGIQGVMIYYNHQKHSMQMMLDLGITCVYLAIIATVAGILQAVIKLFQIIFQNVTDGKAETKTKSEIQVQVQRQKNNYTQRKVQFDKQFANPIYCNLGKEAISRMLPVGSKDSIETADHDTADKRKLTNKSLLKKATNGIKFFSKLMNKYTKNQVQGNRPDESFEKMDIGNQLVSLGSYDQLAISVRKRNTSKRKYQYGQQKNQEKQTNNLKKATTLQEQNRISNKRQIISSNKKQSTEGLYQIPKSIDHEIEMVQNRIRQKMNLKKKISLPNQSFRKLQFQTIDQQFINPAPMVRRQPRQKSVKPSLQTSTQRVKHEEKNDQLMQKINQKKTARRRNLQRNKNSLILKENKKQTDKDQDDDIYYIE